MSDADLTLMHRIDKLHLELPFAGVRMLRICCAAKVSPGESSTSVDTEFCTNVVEEAIAR